MVNLHDLPADLIRDITQKYAFRLVDILRLARVNKALLLTLMGNGAEAMWKTMLLRDYVNVDRLRQLGIVLTAKQFIADSEVIMQTSSCCQYYLRVMRSFNNVRLPVSLRERKEKERRETMARYGY